MLYTKSKFFGPNIFSAATIIFLLVFLQCVAADTVQLSDLEIDSKLMALKPLPKVHYFWPPVYKQIISERRLYELARITHTLCVSGRWAKQEKVDNHVYICARVNKTKPVIETSLGINFLPWHRFDKNLPPTDRGPAYFEEIRYFEEHALRIKQWIAQSNKKYKSNVKIGAITLNSERFHRKAGDKLWNEGIREALDAIHIKAKAIFPNARIEWYGRGIRSYRYDLSPYWTHKEIKAPLSCSLYRVPEIEVTRETFRRTCALADQLGIQDVTPWVALASGWRRDMKDNHFDADWNYDIIYSYLLGAELNNKWYGDRPKRFAPYNRAKVVIFYPPPFDKRAPHWAKHFIAYVRGATREKKLKDLGFEEE